MRHRALIYILALVILVLTVVFNVHSTATAFNKNTVNQQSIDVTPTPQGNQTENRQPGLPWLGIIVLLAPAAYMVWQKSRPGYDQKIKVAGCLPVIDGEKKL